MPRIFKVETYYELLILIYKYSNYEKSKAEILLNYVGYHLVKHGINQVYINKLIIDLNMFDVGTNLIVEPTETEYKKTLKQFHDVFNDKEIIELKSIIFDLLHNSYYN